MSIDVTVLAQAAFVALRDAKADLERLAGGQMTMAAARSLKGRMDARRETVGAFLAVLNGADADEAAAAAEYVSRFYPRHRPNSAATPAEVHSMLIGRLGSILSDSDGFWNVYAAEMNDGFFTLEWQATGTGRNIVVTVESDPTPAEVTTRLGGPELDAYLAAFSFL